MVKHKQFPTIGWLLLLVLSLNLASCSFDSLNPQNYVNQLFRMSPPQWDIESKVRTSIRGIATFNDYIFVIGEHSVTRFDSLLGNPKEYVSLLSDFRSDKDYTTLDPPGSWQAYLWMEGGDQSQVLFNTKTGARIFLFDSSDAQAAGSALLQGSLPTSEMNVPNVYCFFPTPFSQGIAGQGWQAKNNGIDSELRILGTEVVVETLAIAGEIKSITSDASYLYLVTKALEADNQTMELYQYELASFDTPPLMPVKDPLTYRIPDKLYSSMNNQSNSPQLIAADCDSNYLTLYYQIVLNQNDVNQFTFVFDRLDGTLAAFVPSGALTIGCSPERLYFAANGSIYSMEWQQ